MKQNDTQLGKPLLLGTGAEVYDDVVFEMTPIRRNPTQTKPDWDDVNLGFLFPKNDASEITYITAQLPHKWKEGSTIYPHVHVIQGYNEQAVFKMAYKWYNIGGEIPAGWTTYTMDTYIKTFDTNPISNLLHGTGVSGATMTISSIIKIKLYRDDNVYTGDMLCDQFDIHVLIDSLGSEHEAAK